VTTYHLFDETPSLGLVADSGGLSLGTEFYVTSPAWVTELRYLSPSAGGSATRRTAALYSTVDGLTGTLVAGPLLLPVPSDGAWVTGALPAPVPLVPGVHYRVVVFHPDGGYVAVPRYFLDSGDRIYGPVVVPSTANAISGKQGSYAYDDYLAFPNSQFNGASYYADVTVTNVDPAGPPPVVLADIALSVGLPTGHPLTLGDPTSRTLVVLPPTGNPMTALEATL